MKGSFYGHDGWNVPVTTGDQTMGGTESYSTPIPWLIPWQPAPEYTSHLSRTKDVLVTQETRTEVRD